MTPPYAPGPPGTAPHPPAQYGPPPAADPIRPRRLWVLGLVGAATFVAGAALATVGSFQTLYRLKLRLGQETTSEGALSQTLWNTTTSGGINGRGLFPDSAGLPVAVGAGLLVVAAVVAVIAAFRPAGKLVTTVRVLGGIGAGVLAGAVGLIALTVSSLLDRTLAQSIPEGGRVEINTDNGLVLLLVGAGVGLLALVPALLPVAPGHARVEPATPPMGFRAPGGYPQATRAQRPPQSGPQRAQRQAAPFPQAGAPQHAAAGTAPQSDSPQHAADEQPEGNSEVTQVVAKEQVAGATTTGGRTDSMLAPEVGQAAVPPATPEPEGESSPEPAGESVATGAPGGQAQTEPVTAELPAAEPVADPVPAEARVFEPTPGGAVEPVTPESTVADKAPADGTAKAKTDG